MSAEGIDGWCTTLHIHASSHHARLSMPTQRNTLRRASDGRSRLGQNFLTDRNIARRIVAAAAIGPEDDVLEIGPGRGALTRLLVEKASRVVAVELDDALAADLPARVGNPGSLTVVQQDALEYKPLDHFCGPFKLVANLPYYVATPLVRRFLAVQRGPTDLIVMVQREVADNMTAGPGKMGLLSVMVQLNASAKTLFSVPPKAFRPQPKVASAVVRLKPLANPTIPVDDADDFISFVAAGFRAPRKQIHNSLRLGLQAQTQTITTALADASIEGTRRPATLSLPEWGDLYSAWLDQQEGPNAEC